MGRGVPGQLPFCLEGTNYLASQELPSPLQNFWSLSVEEQFYLVYPTLFLLVAAVRTRISLLTRLAIGLGLIIVASFAWSVAQTSSNPTVAFFSPLTRAWELALGGLVAVGARWLLRIPRPVAAALTWAGIGAVLVSAFVFTSQTAYPGSSVAIPVVGAALIIAGGTAAPSFGAESGPPLRRPSAGWGPVVRLYLGHWPILIIAAENSGKTGLHLRANLPWLALALLAAVISYLVVENPVRHAKFLWWPPSMGQRRPRTRPYRLTLVVATVHPQPVGVSAGPTPVHKAINRPGTERGDRESLVRKSQPRSRQLPADLTPSLAVRRFHDYGARRGGHATPATGSGYRASMRVRRPRGLDSTTVSLRDSHALMWFRAVNAIAPRRTGGWYPGKGLLHGQPVSVE